jgi:DNA-binding FadR family transcriptional regulator
MKYTPQIIELADGTKCVYLEDFRRECDEWAAMCGRYKQERDIAEADATNFHARIFELINERDEARAITKEAITGLYNLGDYDLANQLSGKLEETK